MKKAVESLPLRGRGLKSAGKLTPAGETGVAPFTGAWIEMTMSRVDGAAVGVAPFTGAWIEI